MNYSIINISNDHDLIDDIILLGDSQKKRLGFLPTNAFIEYADRGSILVAITTDRKVLGYTLFAQKQNRVCRLTHVCVDQKWRKIGVGNALISHLKKVTSQMSHIIVKCRRDYGIDSFWEKNEFIARGETSGRGLNDTTLTLWECRLQRSLLTLPPERTKPLAVLDLNVVIKENSSPGNDYKSLITFTFSDEIDFGISLHSYTEANRNNNKESRELTRCRLNSLQHIEPCKDPSIVQSTLNIIGQTNTDDAQQIASAIYNNAEFFITRDTGILNHSRLIQKEFGINIYSPTDFIVNYCNDSGRDLYFPGYLNSSEILFKPIGSLNTSEMFQEYKGPDERKHAFESCLNISTPDIENHSLFRIFVKNKEIGFCVRSKVNTDLIVRILRLKKSIKHMHTLAAHIIENILHDSISLGINKITVTDKSCGRLVEQALIDTGFQQSNDCFLRHIGKGFLTTTEAYNKVGLNKRTDVAVTNPDLVDLENSLWPAKLEDLNIPIYIVPIRPKWAQRLISSRGHQLPLMDASNVMLQTRRVYYRSTNGITINAPGRIVWYITGNNQRGLCKCVVGVSLINQVDLGAAKTLYKKYERFGVYTWSDILNTTNNQPDSDLMAIVFSKTEIFTKTLNLSTVSSIINNTEGRSFNPVAPFKINQDSFTEIYKLGTGCGH